MPELLTHPPKEQLTAFGLGKLDSEQASWVEQHLEACADCCVALSDLRDDSFVGLVRQCDPSSQTAGTIGLDAGTTVTRGGLPAELARHARYEVLELIGRGGMGDVYKAQHKVMQRQVALKVIKPELIRNEAAVRRFQREVQAAARLHHKHIVTAHDAEQAGDVHFLVMEYVDGVNLDEVVRRRGPLPVADACRYIRQAAEGLQHAHELGMVHRDIKPHNLMLTNSGEVRILDFGLAGFATEVAEEEIRADASPRNFEPAAALHQLTQMGTMMGTPDYIAPEQAANAHAADIRADIYSLGCTFYTLLAGRPPFDPSSVFDKIKAHAEQTPRTLADFRADVPAEIEAILLKMLAKNPADRYQFPQEVIAAIEKLPASTPAPTPQGAPQRVAHRPRSKVLIALASLFFAAVAATAFYIQTNHGVVRVEVADESLQVKLNGRTIEMKDGETPLTIHVGEPKLLIQRGDFKFETDSFQLRRGDKVALKVDIHAGEIVVVKDGRRFGAKSFPNSAAQAQRMPPPLTIGMNDEFGMLFEGRLVAPAELSRRLVEALKENPDRAVAIDLPKKKWTVAGHVDQLEQVAKIAGAKQITRPVWSEIRIVFGVINGSAQTLVIEGPGHSASGFAKSYLPNVREVITKNPGLPVFLDVADGVDLSNAEIAEGFAEVRRVAEAAGAEVRLGPKAKPQAAVNKPSAYFERLAKVPGPDNQTWTTLDSVVRERVGGGPGRRVTSERIPQPAGRLRYEAQIDGVGSKIIDNVFVDLKDILMRGTDARVVHEGERGVDLRLFRYTTPTRNGEVRVTLTSRELGGQPADESQKWLLKVEASEWNKGEGQGAPAVVRVDRQAEQMKLYLDGAPLSRDEVLARLDALAKGDPGFQVRVEGDVVPVQADVLDLVAAIGATAVGEKNVKFSAEVTTRVMDEAGRRGKQMALLYGNWTETTDEQRGPVHTLRILKSGEFHETGPMVISLDGGPKQWVTKDLDGDGREDIVPFQMSGTWEIQNGHLLTETTSSNVLGFKNERPGNQRRFRIETLTNDKLVLVLVEDGKDVDRWTAFREVSKAPGQQP